MHKFKDREREYHRQWRRENPGKAAAYTNRMHLSYKESAINMYSNGDACCKFCRQADIDVLCLDHIDNDGVKQRLLNPRRGHDLYRWLRLNDYPGNYQVLCFNCNMKKAFMWKRGEVLHAPSGL